MQRDTRFPELLAATAVVATAVALVLIEAVCVLSGESTHGFLLWNLFLAWVPLWLALAASRAHGRGLGLVGLSPMLAGWLLFFPNAPYVVTDFVHLGRLNASLPLPLDFVVLLVAALAGMLLGFASLAFLERIVAERAGCGWSRAVVMSALVLSSFGVYLGRVRRWNSWDAVASPQALVADVTRVVDPFAHPLAWGGTFGFALFLLAAYAAARRAWRAEPIC